MDTGDRSISQSVWHMEKGILMAVETSTIGELDGVVTPALADVYELQQGGTSYKITGTQLLALLLTSTTVENVLTGDIDSHTHSAVSAHTHDIGDVSGLGSIASYGVWFGTDAEYIALGTYDDEIIYLVAE